MITQGISVKVIGPERKKTIITLDLNLCYRALHLQESTNSRNWVLCAGTLLILFATQLALGKTIESIGLDTCLVESGMYTCAALRKIHSGKKYKRGIGYHLVTSLTVMMLKFDVLLSETSVPVDRVKNFLVALESRSSSIADICLAIEEWYANEFTKFDGTSQKGGLAKFLNE